jgi:predicted GNAT family acetyltransferase
VGRLTKLRTGVGYINSIATAPRAARRGWASAITTQLVNRALEFGLTPALFYWERGLAPLYESVGFTHDGDWLVIEGPQLQFG